MSPKTSSIANPAPRNEAKTLIEKCIVPRKETQIAKAKLAPALIPKIPESASGFLLIPCISAPAHAKLAPMRRSPIVRGILKSNKTICCWLERSGFFNASKIVESSILVLPNTIEASERRTKSKSVHDKKRRRLHLFRMVHRLLLELCEKVDKDFELLRLGDRISMHERDLFIRKRLSVFNSWERIP